MVIVSWGMVAATARTSAGFSSEHAVGAAGAFAAAAEAGELGWAPAGISGPAAPQPAATAISSANPAAVRACVSDISCSPVRSDGLSDGGRRAVTCYTQGGRRAVHRRRAHGDPGGRPGFTWSGGAWRVRVGRGADAPRRDRNVIEPGETCGSGAERQAGAGRRVEQGPGQGVGAGPGA